MTDTLATFARRPGERRVEVDVAGRSVSIAYYVPQLNRPPRVEQRTLIREHELDATISALIEARERLRASREQSGGAA